MASKAVILQGVVLAYLLYLSGGSITGIFNNLVPLIIGEALVLLLFYLGNNGPAQKVEGSIFITGCDSGMGRHTAIYLAEKGFKIFAAVLLSDSIKELKEKSPKIIPIQLDVTKLETIQAAVEIVKEQTKNDSVGLVGIVNCAAIAFTGPFEYFPFNDFKKMIEVNLLGYVAVTQSLLPLLKQTTSNPKNRRGRIIFFGTGGGVPAPSPPFLTAYMASKWGIDAVCQSMRIEFKARKYRIDCCVVNPGATKPTALWENGLIYVKKLWTLTPPQAEGEYDALIKKFVHSLMSLPASDVSNIATTVEAAFSAPIPPLRYCVGIDSKVSPIVGLLPTAIRETLLIKQLLGDI